MGEPERESASVPLTVHGGLLAVQVIFGGFHVVANGILATLTPLALVGIRVSIATPILLVLAWRHDRILPRKADLPHLALLGLLGVFVNQILFLVGLGMTTATNASILMPSIPVFAALVAGVFGIERLGLRRLAGVALTVAGALVLLRPSRLTVEGMALGNALILVNCLSFASFLVLQRPLLRRLPWRTVIAWSFLFGSLGVLPVTAREVAAVDFGSLGLGVLAGIAYIILFPTVINYSLNTWAISRSTPSLVAAYTNLQPFVAASLAVPLLGESVGWREAVGFVLIASGLWVTSRKKTPHAEPGRAA